jgi:hypothetical protein
MEWALLLFLLVILGVHWFDYNRAVKEYIFAQMLHNTDIGSVVGEKTPIMTEVTALPWRPEIAEKSSWTVTTMTGESIPFTTWFDNRVEIDTNLLAKDIELSTGLSEINEARSVWWLPDLYNISVDLLEPDEIMGLSWVTAERQWIGCSSGGPLVVWLVHSRYRNFLPNGQVDPWSLTSEKAPYLARVQYIEVRIQPGWVLGLPTHWGWAVRNIGTTAWSWTAEQHSLLSYAVSQAPAATSQIMDHVQDMIM